MSTVSCEQIPLFDIGVNVSRVRAAKERLMGCSRAPNTARAYASSWRMFCAWCADAGRESLPASVETVSLFVAWCVDEGFRLKTVRLRLAAVADRHRSVGHPSPVDESVRGLLSGAARELREKPAGKAAMTPGHLRSVSDLLLADGSVIAVRDRALICVGFAAGRRRGDLSSLDLRDVSFIAGGLRLRFWVSKTDQEGKGCEVRIPCGRRALTCPVRALRAWLDVRGRWAGPLFCRISSGREVLRHGISGDTVCQRVKCALRRAGENPDAFGAHSLRAGMATAAAEAGASEFAIMQRAGWKSIQTALGYVRPAQAFRADPLAGVL